MGHDFYETVLAMRNSCKVAVCLVSFAELILQAMHAASVKLHPQEVVVTSVNMCDHGLLNQAWLSVCPSSVTGDRPLDLGHYPTFLFTLLPVSGSFSTFSTSFRKYESRDRIRGAAPPEDASLS